MDPNRVNLENHKPVYISLTLILLILSAVGIFLLFQIIKTRTIINNSSPENTQTVSKSIPTQVPITTNTPIATITGKISPTIKLSPTIKPTASPSAKLTPTTKPTVTPKLTSTPSATPSPVNGLLNFSSSADKFSVSYSSSRKLYQDKEVSGNRYTFSNTAGNFAVHVGLDGKWAWVNNSRNFTNTLLVSGQPTFRYDISTQTIVDLQYDNKNYTIQCVHNGKQALKTECEEFLKNFQLL